MSTPTAELPESSLDEELPTRGWRHPVTQPSLPEVFRSIAVPKNATFLRRLAAFVGPGYLVAVGYMDPGNWATDLEGGARFGYRLLWVLVMSNAMAILLQTLGARLGIVSGRDLAQACRETYPRPVTWTLYVLCEIAIVACDLAEVLGAAIALKLLFHIPLLVGVAITAGDTLLLLWLQRYGIRKIEAIVLMLIVTIGVCFAIEIFWAEPSIGPMLGGLLPRLNAESLYIAIAIIGATVMPHNLYLHSALVQTRRIGDSD
ncbi:MAG: Nramp family divalent metal transporter, partial [Armatimonadota bacterium]|nr:Nramp family divalent metal transporter [Armatimonadota bacterium]